MIPESTQAKSEPAFSWRIFVVPAVGALLGYVLLYGCDARLRDRRGPWEVTFLREADGSPAVRLQQPGLGLSNITVRFVGERIPDTPPHAFPVVVRFDAPLQPVPFGRTAFDDLMYLPGTVVLQCFGHEVQMLPRTLYLNRQNRGWTNNIVIELKPSEKPATLEPPPRRGASGGTARPAPPDLETAR